MTPARALKPSLRPVTRARVATWSGDLRLSSLLVAITLGAATDQAPVAHALLAASAVLLALTLALRAARLIHSR